MVGACRVVRPLSRLLSAPTMSLKKTLMKAATDALRKAAADPKMQAKAKDLARVAQSALQKQMAKPRRQA